MDYKNKQDKQDKQDKQMNGQMDGQIGGAAAVCNLEGSPSAMMYPHPPIDIQNLNPQASIDGQVMKYGTPVPLGSNIIYGGGSCGDEGVGTGNPKSETFKQYLDNLSKSLDINIQAGGENKMSLDNNSNSISSSMPRKLSKYSKRSKRSNRAKLSKHRGGGVSVDPSEMIGGQPVNKGYDDCCPPAIVGGQLQFPSPDQPICGLGAIRGGARRRSHRSHRNKKHNNRSRKNKSRQNNKNNNRRSKTQRGGDFTSVGSSKPAAYADAFNGEPGIFEYPADMSKRTFDGRQPSWPVSEV
jgi:hypothetical protein